MKVLRVAFLSALVLEILASISTAIIAVEIGLRLLYKTFDFQSAMFILILAPEFYLPLRRLGSQFHTGQESVAAAQKLYEILDQPIQITENDSKKINTTHDFITFENVTFKYDETAPNAIENINFKLKKGKFTALVGHSGSGKSTIVNLLLKFITPTSGQILLDGEDFSAISTENWRKNISIIPQKPYIFHASFKDNIDIGRIYKPEQIIEAARSAFIHDFIESLPNGYDTIVGEQGTKLSGGQIQRIALARAFLRDSEILILDEPTSNLDPHAENMIFEALQNLTKNKTVLAIAHRLKTIQTADNIIVLNQGKIEESGIHSELIEKKSTYFKLVSGNA
jgi:ATP-binding cassette subfamily C protein CydD